jgi:hypothetical protein
MINAKTNNSINERDDGLTLIFMPIPMNVKARQVGENEE